MYLIAGAKQRRYFVCGENGVGRRMNKTVALHALTFDGTPRHIAQVMIRSCRWWPICLADLQPTSEAA